MTKDTEAGSTLAAVLDLSLGLRRPAPVDAAYLLGTAVAALLVFVAGDPGTGLGTALALAHVPVWPVGNLLQIAAVAGLLTAVYVRRRTLVPVAGAHALVWVLAVLGKFYG